LKYPAVLVADERMSKITFRADDDLVRQLEEFDASKSEVMREALRDFLDESASDTVSVSDDADDGPGDSIDDLIAERVDAIIADRLDGFDGAFTPAQPQDINVNIALDGQSAGDSAVDAKSASDRTEEASHTTESRKTPPGDGENTGEDAGNTCGQCGENVSANHVYCPNCGEKTSHRVFCDCGDELRSDWAFCPSCGKRTPAADVLDQG
jgi:Arc/MetJ-type ribon-helix-helix transcriptional regulator